LFPGAPLCCFFGLANPPYFCWDPRQRIGYPFSIGCFLLFAFVVPMSSSRLFLLGCVPFVFLWHCFFLDCFSSSVFSPPSRASCCTSPFLDFQPDHSVLGKRGNKGNRSHQSFLWNFPSFSEVGCGLRNSPRGTFYALKTNPFPPPNPLSFFGNSSFSIFDAIGWGKKFPGVRTPSFFMIFHPPLPLGSTRGPLSLFHLEPSKKPGVFLWGRVQRADLCSVARYLRKFVPPNTVP